MATESFGAIIVELRANSAQFTAELEKARGGLKGVGEHAALSTRNLSRFGAIAAEQVIPGLKGSRVAIENMIQAVTRLRGSLALLGPGLAAVGAGIAGFALGNAIQNFRDLQKAGFSYFDSLKMAVGITKSYEQATKDAAEEQKMFSQEMAKSRDVVQGFEKELATLRDDQETLLKLSDDDRRKKIQTLDVSKRARAEAVAEEAATEAARQARNKRQEDLLETIIKGRDEQVKAFKDETAALVSELEARLEIRKRFNELLAKGLAGAGGAEGGFTALSAAEAQTKAEAQALALRQAAGQVSETDVVSEQAGIRERALSRLAGLKDQFAGLPPVLDAIAKAERKLDFGQLGNEMAAARQEVALFVTSNSELEQRLGAVGAQLTKTLPNTKSAGDAIAELTTKYQALMFAVFGATQQVANFNAVTAGGGETRAELPNTGIQVVE